MTLAQDAEFLGDWLDFGLFQRGRAAMASVDAFESAKPTLRASLLVEALHQYALAVDDVAMWADACRRWERRGGPLAVRLDEADAGQSWEMLRSLERESAERVRKMFGLPRFSAPEITNRNVYRKILGAWAGQAATVAKVVGVRTPDDSDWLVARINNKIKHGMHVPFDAAENNIYIDGLQSQPVSLQSVQHFAKQTCMVSEFLGGILHIFATIRLGTSRVPKWYLELTSATDPENFETVRALVMNTDSE